MQIEEVEFLSDYIVKLHLSNKQIVYYDLKPQLRTARFHHITSEQIFKTGILKRNCMIYWDPVTEIQDYEMLGEKYIERNIE